MEAVKADFLSWSLLQLWIEQADVAEMHVAYFFKFLQLNTVLLAPF